MSVYEADVIKEFCQLVEAERSVVGAWQVCGAGGRVGRVKVSTLLFWRVNWASSSFHRLSGRARPCLPMATRQSLKDLAMAVASDFGSVRARSKPQ